MYTFDREKLEKSETDFTHIYSNDIDEFLLGVVLMQNPWSLFYNLSLYQK